MTVARNRQENLSREQITGLRPHLEYAILGLIHGAPRSGYDIRKIFASSLLRLFSDSPGSVYPALRRLERDELIQAPRKGRRGLRVFRLTRSGRAALRRWVATPIEAEELRKNPDAFSLQFAYMDGLIDRGSMSEMLRDYARVFRALESEVTEFQNANEDTLPPAGYLVLNLGGSLCRARIRWARQTIEALKEST